MVASVWAMSASNAAHSSSLMSVVGGGSLAEVRGGARFWLPMGRMVGVVVVVVEEVVSKKSAGRGGPRESGCDDENSDEMMDEDDNERGRGRPLALILVGVIDVVDVYVRTVF